MKLLKLSLAAVLATGTLYAADSLEEAFKNGKVDGELRAFYFGRDYHETSGLNGVAGTDSSLLAIGGRLSYETDELNGFRVGMGFQGQSVPVADSDTMYDHQFEFDLGASGAIMSEAYLSYAMDKTTIKIGRQYFDKPLMTSDNRDVIRQAIEGVTVVNEDLLPNTTLYGAYAWRMHWMKGAGNDEFASFEKFGLSFPEAAGIGDHPNSKTGEYAYVVGAINKSLPDTTLTLAYGEQDQSHTLLLAQADYMPKINDSVTLVTGLQYWQTEEDGAKSYIWDDSTVYSGKLGVNVGPVGAYVAYSKIEDGRSAWGVGMTDDRPRLYTSTLTDAGFFEASEQFAVDFHAFVPPIATVLGVRYVNIDLDEDGETSFVGTGEIDQTGFYAIHHFKGALKGLYCMGFYEISDNSDDHYSRDELRFRIGYEF